MTSKSCILRGSIPTLVSQDMISWPRHVEQVQFLGPMLPSRRDDSRERYGKLKQEARSDFQYMRTRKRSTILRDFQSSDNCLQHG